MTALKLRSKVNFPATVTATGGLAVSKSNGIWTVQPDWTYLSLETVIPDAAGRQLWTLDPATNTYYRLSVQALIDNLPAGPAGSAATIVAGTTGTSAAGSSATATNSGTSSAAILDFTIPRGADAGMRYAFESSTSMSAPSLGGIRLNNAALASVTAIAVNATNADAVDVSDFVATWDDSTNTVKGYIEVRKEGSGAVLGLYQLTSVTDNTSWLQLAVTYVSGSGSLTAADPVYLTPYRTGNKGADGAGTGDFSSNTATSVDGEMVLFSGTGGKTGKRSTLTGGLLKSTSGVPAIASAGTDYVAPSGALGTPSSGTLTNCTGLPVSGIASSTSTALGVGSLEVGNASDTTISRSAAGVIAVEGVPLYSNIPQNSQSAAYTLVLADAQKHIYHPSADTTARTWTIPANASVAFPIGTAVTFVNDTSGGVITISITSDTLVLAGTGSTGNRSLAANGVATAIKITSTRWIISGTGLT